MKTKISHRLLSLGLTLMMVFSLAATAMAAPRYAVCEDCGGQINLVSTIVTPWTYQYSKPCDHGYARGNDDIYTQRITSTWQCSKCGAGMSSDLEDKDIRCHGYDHQ